MKYINTREAYLNLINETFTNETTWGGSLLGRLVNSIIRKAKVEVNYQKVKSIAHAIKAELDGLIANGMSQEDKNLISKITAKALLEEIYDVVSSDESEKVKLYQLLDENKDGLITQAINFLEILPDGTNLGRGSNDELIEKLKKFKELLESINDNTEELTEEEKEELGKKIDQDDDSEDDNEEEKEEDDDSDLEETGVGDDFDSAHKLLQSILGMNNEIEGRLPKRKEHKPGLGKPNSNKEEDAQEVEGQDVPNTSDNGIAKKNGPRQHPDISITKNTPHLLNKGTHAIDQVQGKNQKNIGGTHNNTKLIGGPNENLMGFWDFLSTINEFRIEGPKNKIATNQPKSKSKGSINEPKLKVVDYGTKKQQPKTNDGEYIDFEMVGDDDKSNNKDQQALSSNAIWDKIIRIWIKSGISNHIAMIRTLVEKSKDESAIERKWVLRIAKQLKVNSTTHGRNMHDELVSETSSDVIATAIPKSISLIANGFYALKDSNTQNLGKFGEYLRIFNSCYEIIVNPDRILKSGDKKKNNISEPNTNVKGLNSPRTEETPNHSNDRGVAKIEKSINYFLDLLKEADEVQPQEPNTELAEPEHELEETQVENDNSNLEVKGAWDQVFEPNEENEWKLSEKEAEESRKKIEDAKFEINLTDENNKDRIIKITNLFGIAYRCYTTSVIPSGRPGGKVSNQTFREYIHLGTGGSPGTPDNPGAGPWANRRVFHNFVNYISSYIENEEYKKIFNYGKIKRTDGKLLKGNVLLEFIRDMIDETALRSYDKRRSEFLNKYFGLEGYTYKEPEGGDGKSGSKSEHAEADETLQWQALNNITAANVSNIEKGSFLAFNVKFKLEGKKEEHKVIIGQVLQITDNKIVLKWLYDNEAVPHAFAGAKLTHGYSYTTTDLKKPPKAEAAPKEPLYIGIIDLSLKLKTKAEQGNSEIETQGIIPNHNFFMVFKDITKPDNTTDYNYHRVHFIPYKNKPGVVNRVIKNAISILVKSDKQDNKNPVIGKVDSLGSKSILPTDKVVNLDETVDQLTNYMERNRNKI